MRLVPFRVPGTAFLSPGPEPRPREPPRLPFPPVDLAPPWPPTLPSASRARQTVASVTGRLTCQTPGMGTTDEITIHAGQPP